MAIVAALYNLVYYLHGTQVKIYTDHRPCTALMFGQHLNKRLHGFAVKLMNFDVEIIYRPGKSNANADGMSRQKPIRKDSETGEGTAPSPSVRPSEPELGRGRCGAVRERKDAIQADGLEGGLV